MKLFHLRVRSRNKSCAPLRELLFTKRAILRLGSTTPTCDITKRKDYIEINSSEACRVSGNKRLMKERFTHGKICSSEWFTVSCGDIHYLKEKKMYFSSRVKAALTKWEKLIVKHVHSSGGNRIFLIESLEDFDKFFRAEDGCVENKHFINQFVFERYYTYSREYRIHVTKDGCFLADRKMLKNDAEVRWHRHSNNCVWISEDNPMFDKPTNWDTIVAQCVNALKAVELDIAAFDVKVQNNKHENPKFIIMESNSAPALGEKSIPKYSEQIEKIIYEEI